MSWSGIEMALCDAGPDGLPRWSDDLVPVLQLNRLDLTLSDGRVATVLTYQNDARWGLTRLDAMPPSKLPSDEPGSIFRVRSLGELPPGQITAVEVEVEAGGDIAAVRLRVGGHEVLLRAGEVYEQADASLRVVPMDESVLVQVDGQRPNLAMPQTDRGR